jgi:hypothetical protein
MGSRTNVNNQRRDSFNRVLKKNENLTSEEIKFLIRNVPRHKCKACGNGGHLRRAPFFRRNDGGVAKMAVRA